MQNFRSKVPPRWWGSADLTGKAKVRTVSPENQLAAVHTGTGEIADDPLPHSVQSQNKNDTARLIFPKEAARAAADDDDRDFILIFLHVDAGAITGIAFYKNLAAAHGVARRVSDAAVNHDAPGVHGIPHRVLGVGMDCDFRAV